MRQKALLYSLIAALCLLNAGAAQAAGFYLQEQSVSAMGAAFAGSAALPRDASTVYYNPAGMTQLEGFQVNAGGHGIIVRTDLDDAGSTLFGAPISGSDSDNATGEKIIPNFFLSKQVTDDFWLGLGVSAPFGLATEYKGDWFGRFDSIKSDLKTVDIQPSIGVKVNDRLALGAGLNAQYADATLTRAVTDGTEGVSTLEGDALTFGYTAGLLFTPRAGTHIGVNYRSSVFHELEGRAKVEGTAASDFDIDASAQLATPDIASFAISQEAGERWTLLGQANWYGWNNYEAITVRNAAGGIISNLIQNYQTTWSYAVGAEYEASDKWTLRAGYQFDETPTTDEYRNTRTPDGDRNWFTAGGTYRLDENWSVDFAGAFINIAEENVNLSNNNGLARTRADTDGYVGIFSLGVNYKF